MRVGDYLRYTRSRAIDIESDPLWLEITGRPDKQTVPVRYCCGGGVLAVDFANHPGPRGPGTWSAIHNYHDGSRMFTVVRKEDLPDEFFTAMAKQALLG